MTKMTLRQLRRSRDYSQRELAQMIGVSIATYQKYEQCPGNIRIKTLLHICEVLDIDVRQVKIFNDNSNVIFVDKE